MLQKKTIRNTGKLEIILSMPFQGEERELWADSYDGPAGGEDIANAVALDSEGNIYITGYSANSRGDFDYVTIKYTP